MQVRVDEGLRWNATDTYFANIDQPAHQVLVTKRRDGLLGLIPCCVFHNPERMSACAEGIRGTVLTRIPTITRGPGPIRQSKRPSK
jgi:hypothetical protein